MKSTISNHPKNLNSQAKLAPVELERLTDQATSQIAHGKIPDLTDVCQELSTTSIKNAKLTFNVLQFEY